MKFKFLNHLPLLAFFVTFPLASLQAQHGHLESGALGKSQGDQLYFANGADFVASSGYVKSLVLTNAGPYAGLYQNSLTMTVLPATLNHGGPATNSPAVGSYIQIGLMSVDGPDGGTFSFWEANATTPTVSLGAGQTGSNRWRLTQNSGAPTADPFGHLHNRRFTATKPGYYKVGFQLFDTSTNGTDGGPIHTPSDVLPVFFQAGVNFQSIRPGTNNMRLRFAAPEGKNWQVETSSLTGSPPFLWGPLGTPVTGDEHFHEVLDTAPLPGSRYYRLRDTAP